MTIALHTRHPTTTAAHDQLASLGAGDSATELTTDWLRPRQSDPMATALRAGRPAARGQLIALGAAGSATELPRTDQVQGRWPA